MNENPSPEQLISICVSVFGSKFSDADMNRRGALLREAKAIWGLAHQVAISSDEEGYETVLAAAQRSDELMEKPEEELDWESDEVFRIADDSVGDGDTRQIVAERIYKRAKYAADKINESLPTLSNKVTRGQLVRLIGDGRKKRGPKPGSSRPEQPSEQNHKPENIPEITSQSSADKSSEKISG